jgi:Gpi18-like mannosyltransferase
MGLAKSNQTVYKITRIHRKHPWIRIYLLTLLVLIIWGNISTRIFPLEPYNSQTQSVLAYEIFAPGWASRGIIRSFLEPWQRWDTNFYLHIAKEGYSVSSSLVAFLPLYPSLIRLVAKLLGGQYLLAALLISWSAIFGSCFLLEERFNKMADQKTAVRGIRNLLFFPTAFFFFAGYTESLFLFFVLLAWRYADRGKWLLAGVVGALATITRFIGVVLVVPFGWNLLQNWRKSKTYSFVGVLLVPAAYIGWGFLVERIYHIQPDMALSSGWVL